jgi:hypothetical protein
VTLYKKMKKYGLFAPPAPPVAFPFDVYGNHAGNG